MGKNVQVAIFDGDGLSERKVSNAREGAGMITLGIERAIKLSVKTFRTLPQVAPITVL